MKLCRFDQDRLGVVIGDAVHDITAVQDTVRAEAPYDGAADAVIAALPRLRGRIEEEAARAQPRPLASVRLLAPVARPSKVIAAPANYAAHAAEMSARADRSTVRRGGVDKAGLFLKANTSLVGPSGEIVLRFPERRNEHEVELVAIIGEGGSDIPPEKALDHVAGYCMGLDITVRGDEDRSFRKSIDTYSPVGPWMVTADEIPDPDNVDIELLVNGETRQKSSTSQLIHGLRSLIALASSFYTLYPGDYIFTGTPEGVGPLAPGDVLEASSPVIGTLTISVAS